MGVTLERAVKDVQNLIEPPHNDDDGLLLCPSKKSGQEVASIWLKFCTNCLIIANTQLSLIESN
jgi:hypothetical protein